MKKQDIPKMSFVTDFFDEGREMLRALETVPKDVGVPLLGLIGDFPDKVFEVGFV